MSSAASSERGHVKPRMFSYCWPFTTNGLVSRCFQASVTLGISETGAGVGEVLQGVFERRRTGTAYTFCTSHLW